MAKVQLWPNYLKVAPTWFFHHFTLYCSSFIEQITSDRFRWQKSSYGQISSKWPQKNVIFFFTNPTCPPQKQNCLRQFCFFVGLRWNKRSLFCSEYTPNSSSFSMLTRLHGQPGFNPRHGRTFFKAGNFEAPGATAMYFTFLEIPNIPLFGHAS